ncbi:MAG: hypothetical protein FWG94_01730 [Oscillospiraceae bacterium]|nr:hypothetical protein [Oscillospiraceae bacterium]
MRRRFEDAIRQVGGTARLPGGEDTFPVSIQPRSVSGDGKEKTGTGFTGDFTVYTVCNAVTMLIEGGDTLEYQNVRYYVRNIETVGFRGEDVYRRGVLTREEEAGY